jgi:DNA-binding transcriptional ArsR family regulator
MSSGRAAEPVDDVLRALADPTRRALFEAMLRTPGLTTSQITDRVSGMSRWGVIKHMAVLRDAGLIQTMATGRLRRHYAETAALGPLRQWLDAIRDS